MKRSRLDNRTSGQACVELAIVLPLLVLLLLGIFDFASMISANNTIANMSREGANLASRSQISTQSIMDTLADTAQPLDMKNNGMLIVTLVQGTNGQPKILSQTTWHNGAMQAASRIGTPTSAAPNPTANNLGDISLKPSQIVSAVEVFYNYQSVFSTEMLRFPGRLYSMTIF